MARINIKLCLLFSLFLSFSFCITQVQSAFGIKLDVNDDRKNAADSDANASDNNVGHTESVGAGSGSSPLVKAESSESSDASNIDSGNSADSSVVEEEVENGNQGEENEEQMAIKEAPVVPVADQEEEKIQNDNENTSDTAVNKKETTPPKQEAVVQSGPFVDLLGETLLSLEMVDQTHAKLNTHYTNDALKGKKVTALYFSAGE